MTTASRPLSTSVSCALRRRSFWAVLEAYSALRRQRRHLAGLDDRMLCDIGVDCASAEHEAARPAWDAPRHWQL